MGPQPVDIFALAGDDPRLWAAKQFVTAKTDQADTCVDRVSYNRFTQAQAAEIDLRSGTEVFIDQ
jgi:hypothetical protein